MKTILKWPGGKEKELPVIRKYSPSYTGRFIEPFVGGGAVFLIQTPRDVVSTTNQLSLSIYIIVQEKK